ncbi:hypothetical protein [Achromobacter arsenitoxydans]|uniref:Lipoprotein n=1 Tax=Achromobacter arsenitoxydans SY8 TaxID=477184 RepID=H0FBL6_9BURK|nr:hypothetical protein [Achromobacter arsenitoxydans]EHK64283.1 hypothetical protein KYC_20864 [Achromobacter arsenitoxydans SY8]
MMSKTLIIASVLAVALSACNKKEDAPGARDHPRPGRQHACTVHHAAGHVPCTGSHAGHHAWRRLDHPGRIDHPRVVINQARTPALKT